MLHVSGGQASRYRKSRRKQNLCSFVPGIYRRRHLRAEEIDEDIYDAFIVVGLQFGIETVLPIYHDYRTSRMNHSRSKYLVSEAYFRSAACDALRTSEAVRIAKMIRSVSRKPIILVPNPRRVLNLQGKRYGAISRASGAELALLDQEYRMACTSAVSASVIVHHQPDETLADGFHTRAELGLSANIPDLSEIPPSRFTHMNEAYGSLLLNSIIGRLGSLLPRRWAKGG